MPAKQSSLAAGYDITSTEDIIIPAHARALVHTGLKVAIPPQTHLEIRPRSGLALKHGITVLNTPGTIDADYRGEIMIILYNTDNTDFQIHAGDRIAQAVLMQHLNASWIETNTLDTTERNEKGFGSTSV